MTLLISCNAQNKVENISTSEELNYYLANIYTNGIEKYSLYDDGLFITSFPYADFKSSQSNYKEDGHEVRTSLLLSVSPDGEYVQSVLFKIGSFILPEVISINQTNYPDFTIVIENGSINNRKIDSYDISVIF